MINLNSQKAGNLLVFVHFIIILFFFVKQTHLVLSCLLTCFVLGDCNYYDIRLQLFFNGFVLKTIFSMRKKVKLQVQCPIIRYAEIC